MAGWGGVHTGRGVVCVGEPVTASPCPPMAYHGPRPRGSAHLGSLAMRASGDAAGLRIPMNRPPSRIRKRRAHANRSSLQYRTLYYCVGRGAVVVYTHAAVGVARAGALLLRARARRSSLWEEREPPGSAARPRRGPRGVRTRRGARRRGSAPRAMPSSLSVVRACSARPQRRLPRGGARRGH